LTIAQEFNRQIKGERLFYNNKETYTKEEAELIVESVWTRMMTNLFYTSMITASIDVLTKKILPKVDENLFSDKLKFINANIERYNNMYRDQIGEEYDYGQFCAGQNYGLLAPYNYFSTVCDNVMDAELFEEIISSDRNACIYPVNRDFLVTANFLFVRKPNFYNDEYVNRLKEMIDFHDKKRILDKDALKQFNMAEKTTLKHIKKYYKKRKLENKGKQKVKKL